MIIHDLLNRMINGKYEYIISEGIVPQSIINEKAYYIKKKYTNGKEKYVHTQELFPGLEGYTKKLWFDTYEDARSYLRRFKNEK